MFLVPQLKYVSILRKADPHEKYELESVNETHQKEGFFDKSMLGLEHKTKVSKMDPVFRTIVSIYSYHGCGVSNFITIVLLSSNIFIQ